MKKDSLAQQTAQTLYKLVVEEARWSAGGKLPNENDLSRQLRVSRATLREAMQILGSQGILRAYPGRGTFVADDIEHRDGHCLGNLRYLKSQLKDLFEARLLFEPELAACACRRATQEELERILALGEDVEQAICSGRDRTDLDQAFHQAIVAASHNEFLQQLVPIINRTVSETIRFQGAESALAEYTRKDHALLVSFLRERNAAGAKSAMAIHLLHAAQVLRLDLEQ